MRERTATISLKISGDDNKDLRRTFFGNIEKRSLLEDLRR